MSIQAVSWALDVKIENPLERVVLIALANHAGAENSCYPSYNTIARMAVCSRRTAMRYVDTLREKGYLKVEERRRENGSATSNIYFLNLGFEGVCSTDPSDRESLGGDRESLGGVRRDTTPSDTGDTTPVSGLTPPEPLLNHQLESSGEKRPIHQWQWDKQEFETENLKAFIGIYPKNPKSKLILRFEWWKQGCEDIAPDILAKLRNQLLSCADFEESRFCPSADAYIIDRKWENKIVPLSDEDRPEELTPGQIAAKKRWDEARNA